MPNSKNTDLSGYCPTIYENSKSNMLNVPFMNNQRKSSLYLSSNPSNANSRMSIKPSVPFKEKELVVMNTTELFQQLLTVITSKSFEYRGTFLIFTLTLSYRP